MSGDSVSKFDTFWRDDEVKQRWAVLLWTVAWRTCPYWSSRLKMLIKTWSVDWRTISEPAQGPPGLAAIRELTLMKADLTSVKMYRTEWALHGGNMPRRNFVWLLKTGAKDMSSCCRDALSARDGPQFQPVTHDSIQALPQSLGIHLNELILQLVSLDIPISLQIILHHFGREWITCSYNVPGSDRCWMYWSEQSSTYLNETGDDWSILIQAG